MDLQESTEQRIYVNSILQKQSGDSDTEFTAVLGNTFSNVRRLVLNNVQIDNYFTNFYGQYANLNIRLATGVIIQIPTTYYVAQDQFLNFLNVYTVPQGLSLSQGTGIAGTWDYRLSIRGNIQWAPVDGTTGWTKLGFPTTNALALTQTGTSAYDFGQSGSILIQFVNLENSITNSVLASFHVGNNTAFGGRIIQNFANKLSNQQVVFSNPKQFDRLQIRMLDCDGNLLTTVQGNNSGAETVLNISAFDK